MHECIAHFYIYLCSYVYTFTSINVYIYIYTGELQGLKNSKLSDTEIFSPLPGGVSDSGVRVGTVGGQIMSLAMEVEESLKRIYIDVIEVLLCTMNSYVCIYT
jgi:hypothetical protein